MPRSAISFLGLLFVGCYNGESTVRTRAAHDLHCDEDALAVVNVSGATYEATGCGQREVYTCYKDVSFEDDIGCVKERR